MNWLRILYDDDKTGGAGGGAAAGAALKDTSHGAGGTGEGKPAEKKEGEGAAAAAVATLDLSSKVRMADGSEMSVQDLISAQGNLATAEAKNKELTDDMKQVEKLFSEEAGTEARAGAVKHILKKQGYTQDQIDYYLQVSGLAEGGEGEGEGAAAAGAKPASGGDDTLRKEVEQLKGEAHKRRLRDLRVTLGGVLDNLLDKNDAVAVLLKKTVELRGEDSLKGAKSTLRVQLERQILDQLNIRRAQTGEFKEEWFEEEAAKAVKPVLDAYQSVIGDLDKLGRAPETVTGGDASILSGKPKEKPVYTDEKSLGDIETDMNAWTEDTLNRAAQAVGPGGPTMI